MSGLTFKSLLNQYCQKARVSLPIYSAKPVQTLAGTLSYCCNVKLFNGASFESKGPFTNKKNAEQDAAKHALVALGQVAGPGEQNTESNVTKTCCGASESISTEESSSSSKNTVQNSNVTVAVTIASTSEGVLMPSVQTADQPKQCIFPTLATAKNILNERAQKLHIALPSYRTEADGVGFSSRVTFNGGTYCSNGSCRLKKEAEKSAALEALKVLIQDPVKGYGNATSSVVESSGQEFCILEEKNKVMVLSACTSQGNSCKLTSDNQEVEMNIQGFSPDLLRPSSSGLHASVELLPNTPVGAQNASVPVCQPSPVSFKNLLQEYMQQRGIVGGPKYVTSMSDFGLFKSTVHFCGKLIECNQGFSTKKQAEQMAARQALLDLGVEEPENLGTSRKAKDRTRKLGSLKRKQFQGPGDLDFLWDSPPNLNPRLRKRPRLDDSLFATQNLKLQSPLVEKTLGHIDFLSVGEIWKEKKNVAIIGNDKTSFVLHCTRVEGSLQILNTRIMENVELRQGYRIIGLDADLVQRQGRLILQSKSCADIEVPEKPDPVLISCGAVVLHLDPNNSSNTEVLLKRYTHSQAFINVKAALAQFFRRAVSGHPLALPVTSLTEHIQQWALEEVAYIAAMDVPAMQQVFLNFWKFKDSWCSVLEPSLPNDLKDLQTRAQEEFSCRISCGANTNDASSYPWGLPKGNFRHRMLSTGLHIERPSECAARELREETGIQVDPCDLERISYVDIPQDDNLNPHKGDVARYFLYIYNPIIEELSSSTNDNDLSNTQSEAVLQSDQSVGACEDVNKDAALPVLVQGEPIGRKEQESESFTDESGDAAHTTLMTCYQETGEENIRIVSLSEKLIDSSSKDTAEKPSNTNTEEPKIQTCPAVPSPPSLSSPPPASLPAKKKTILAKVKENSKESLNSSAVKDPCVTSCTSISSSTTTAAASSSSLKKKTPLNTDFETEYYSSKDSNFSCISRSDPIYPTMPCKGNSFNIDSEIKDYIQEDNKMLDLMEDSELGAKRIADDEQQSLFKNDNESTDDQYSTDLEKRGQKRKRGSSEDEESRGEDDKPDNTHQVPGTSTPVATDLYRYQSPIVQGAKHEECSWFPIEEALKISPTFATIYETEKFSELLMLLKNTWT